MPHHPRTRFLTPLALAVLLAATPAQAEVYSELTAPPSGDNQFSSITQGIGLVRVTIEYNSPDVHAPDGTDRRGKIWGGVVPFGMASFGFTCGTECPWRGGANENTLFTTSHDVKVQGQPLPAGSYGLHFIAGPEEWTVIFSRNTTSWGSYYYDPKEDALRVQVKPEKAEYNEWLTYEFVDRKPDRATVALKWEDLQVPFTVTVDDPVGLYLDKFRSELRSHLGFGLHNWAAAARYALDNKRNLDEALTWAEQAAGSNRERASFSTLVTLSGLQEATGKAEEAKKTLDMALGSPVASPEDIFSYGSQLLAEKKNEEALKTFRIVESRFPQSWMGHAGLARTHNAMGNKKDAVAKAKAALAVAPDPMIRDYLEKMVQRYEAQ